MSLCDKCPNAVFYIMGFDGEEPERSGFCKVYAHHGAISPDLGRCRITDCSAYDEAQKLMVSLDEIDHEVLEKLKKGSKKPGAVEYVETPGIWKGKSRKWKTNHEGVRQLLRSLIEVRDFFTAYDYGDFQNHSVILRASSILDEWEEPED